MTEVSTHLRDALWRIYRQPERPLPWTNGGNLPWDDPAFSERMLREHLDQSHGAASRVTGERERQIDWLWPALALQPGHRLLDVTCGPGLYAVALAQRGLHVAGIDFAPAAIAYARELATGLSVADRCQFQQADVRQARFPAGAFDAALLLYGQLAVFPRDEAQGLVAAIAKALRPGGRLAVELLDPARIDRRQSSWWYTDETGLWGDEPYLHLGQRFWDEATAVAIERYLILHLTTGQLDEIHLCDQAYTPAEVGDMLRTAGFNRVDVFPAWDGLPLYDAGEWIVYVAEK